MKVLLAEDDADLSEVASRLLASWGCEVTAVPDGQAAYDLVEGGSTFDLLVLDYGMPGRSGLEVGVRARELGHGGPVVVWTGWSVSVTQEQIDRWDLVLLSKYDVYELGSVVTGLRAQDGARHDVTRPLP